jgi:hypothetical protein
MVVVAEVCRSAPKSTSQKVRDRARWSVPENRLAFGQLPLTSGAIRWEIQKVLPLLRQLRPWKTAYRSSNGHLIFPLTSNHGYSARSGCRRRRSRLLRTPLHHRLCAKKDINQLQGRAGLVALRRYRGGTSAIGKAFYKGGFEKTMNKREAALILECS